MDKLSTYGNLVAQMQTQRNWADESWFNRQQADIANSQWQQSFSRQQLLDELSREDVSYDRKWQIAQYLYENTGNASAFRSLGLSDAEIAALTGSYAAALQGRLGSGSSGGSGGYKPVLTYNQVMDAVDRGNITPQVEKDYRYYMGTEYDTGTENEGGLSEAALSLKAQLESPALDRTDLFGDQAKETPQTNRKNLIERAVSSGRITEKEAMALLDYFGL